MKAVRLAATLALVTLPLACGDIAAQAGPRLTVKLQIEMDYEDLEFGHEGYVSSYAHGATLTLTGFTFDSEITQTMWDGFEVCIEPPLRIEWKSDMAFEDLDYTAPVMRALVRGDQVWILYAPAREFGVEHPGRPECNSGAYVPAGQMVAKHFFEADLADLAPPRGDFPVFIYDEEDGERLVGHSGSVAGYNAFLVFEPVTGVGVVLLRNYGGGETDLGDAGRNLLRRLLAAR